MHIAQREGYMRIMRYDTHPSNTQRQLHGEFPAWRYFDHDHDGVTVLLVEESEIYAYMQYTHRTGQTVYIEQIESHRQGCGRVLVNFLQQGYDRVFARGVLRDAVAFWIAMGFRPTEEDANDDNCVDYVWLR